MNLAAKFRPQKFDEIVGQNSLKEILRHGLISNRPPKVLLFCGTRGVGKTTAARLFARAVNCENLQNGDPCGECNFCKSFAENRAVDLIEIDAASHTGVDNVREIIEKMRFAPVAAKNKIYIVDEVHMLSRGAFNALLKTLEEPPAHVFFILATTELQKIPATIQSRCQIFLFRKFTIEQISDRLRQISAAEKIPISDLQLAKIARGAAGGMRDAISILEKFRGAEKIDDEILSDILQIVDESILSEFWEKLRAREISAAVEIAEKIFADGFSPQLFWRNFLEFLRQKLRANLNSPANLPEISRAIEVFSPVGENLKICPVDDLPILAAIA